MARIVEIDDNIFEWLQREAEPLVDTISSVLRRVLPMDVAPTPRNGTRITPAGSGGQPPPSPVAGRSQGLPPVRGRRTKLNEEVLRNLGVSHFEVDGSIPEYRGKRARTSKRAHPRAYLDALLDKKIASFQYYERHDPRGDAASRVILDIGAEDNSSVVHFHHRPPMQMAEFVEAFLTGQLQP